MNCLICESSGTQQIDSITSHYVINSYKKLYNTDFSYLFTDAIIFLYECQHCGLRFFSPAKPGDSRFYNTIQQSKWYYRTQKEEYKYASSQVNRGEQVLDIGCGSGAFSRYIPEAHFTGLELSTDAISSGVQSGVNIINESIETHALGNCGKYDVVTMFQVLEHVPNLKGFLTSAVACLKPNGRLVVAVPSEEAYISFRSNAVLNMPPHHMSRWSDEALRNLANVFDIDLLHVFHEALDPIHNNEFLTVFFERLLKFNLRERAKLEDSSLKFRIRNTIAIRLASLFRGKELSSSLTPIGHTVIAVYRKREN